MIRYLLVVIFSLSIALADAVDGCGSGGADCPADSIFRTRRDSPRALSTIFIYSPVTTITLPRREVSDATFPVEGLGPPVAATPPTTPTTLITATAPAYPATPTPSLAPPSPEGTEYPATPASSVTPFSTVPMSNPHPGYEIQSSSKTVPVYRPRAIPTFRRLRRADNI